MTPSENLGKRFDPPEVKEQFNWSDREKPQQKSISFIIRVRFIIITKINIMTTVLYRVHLDEDDLLRSDEDFSFTITLT